MADLLHHYPSGVRSTPQVQTDVPPRVFWVAVAGIAAVMAALAYAASGPLPEAMFDPNLLSQPTLPFMPLL